LTGGVASIGAVRVGVNQFPDRQPVGHLLQRQVGMLAAPELARCHCLFRFGLERPAHGLIVAITSAGVDVLPDTPEASPMSPQTLRSISNTHISPVVP
jgi:hypothetical protein